MMKGDQFIEYDDDVKKYINITAILETETRDENLNK